MSHSSLSGIKRVCRLTGKPFVVTPLEQELLKKFAVPLPTLCPLERLRKLTAFSNYMNLYQGRCQLGGEHILQAYRPGVPFPVYSNPAWWSDAWEAGDYGRPYDFARPFFDQFRELRNAVPQPALTVTYLDLENCDYINGASYCKNCYLLFHAGYDEDCYFSFATWHSRDCIDCSMTTHSELCYDSTCIEGCYEVRHSFNCQNCRDSAFLWNCIGCHDCFGCVNLRHREYCYYNEQLTPQDYAERIRSLEFDNYETVSAQRQRFTDFVRQHPQPAVRGFEFGGSSGDFIVHCKNSENCYSCAEIEDCANCIRVLDAKDCMDQYGFGNKSQLVYCSVRSGTGCHNIRFSILALTNCSDLEYCMFCSGCRNCFGCIGLRSKEYCILNKQYRRSDYEELHTRIVRQMLDPDANGGQAAYGEFFPYTISPYPVNDSDCQIFFPLEREEAEKIGAHWEDGESAGRANLVRADRLPLRSRDAQDSLTQEIYAGLTDGQPFKITAQELKLYRKRAIPLPREHWRTRMLQREKRRNPFELHPQLCARTGQHILSTFPPDSGWIVWENDAFSGEFG